MTNNYLKKKKEKRERERERERGRERERENRPYLAFHVSMSQTMFVNM